MQQQIPKKILVEEKNFERRSWIKENNLLPERKKFVQGLEMMDKQIKESFHENIFWLKIPEKKLTYLKLWV